MTENWITYFGILLLVFAVLMTIWGILHWIADPAKRVRRLMIISICSLGVLIIFGLFYNWKTIMEVFNAGTVGNDSMTESLVYISKISIKAFLIAFGVAFSFILILIVITLLVYSMKAIVHTISAAKENDANKLQEKLKKEADKMMVFLKNPVFIMSIAGGILALFAVLPLVMGEPSESLADSWKSGVTEIVSFAVDEEGFSRKLSKYLLIFIAIIGIGYGVGNILFEIIKERFKRKNGLLKEYSTPIGLLAVGISVLLLAASPPDNSDKVSWIQLLRHYSRPFLIVIFVIALAILVLEVVRLLMDMRERMIRIEARYLFVLLVGLCTVIIMRAFLLGYNVVNSILEGDNIKLERAEVRIQKVSERIIEKVAKDMEKEIEHKNIEEVPYNIFKGKTTKK